MERHLSMCNERNVTHCDVEEPTYCCCCTVASDFGSLSKSSDFLKSSFIQVTTWLGKES
jgi:hypothetical protein